VGPDGGLHRPQDADLEALSVFMGHSSIKVTFDLYGHLMPGTEAEAAALLDGFLDRRTG